MARDWKDTVGSMSGESEDEARAREARELAALKAQWAKEEEDAKKSKP